MRVSAVPFRSGPGLDSTLGLGLEDGMGCGVDILPHYTTDT